MEENKKYSYNLKEAFDDLNELWDEEVKEEKDCEDCGESCEDCKKQEEGLIPDLPGVHGLPGLSEDAEKKEEALIKNSPVNINIDAHEFGGKGNDVSVLSPDKLIGLDKDVKEDLNEDTSEEEIPETDANTVEEFINELKEYDGKLAFEFKPIEIGGKEYNIYGFEFDDSEEGKIVASIRLEETESDEDNSEESSEETEDLDK